MREAATLLAAMAASTLPHRHWQRLPSSYDMNRAAFAAGLAVVLLGAAIGVPGFLHHAGATVSLGNEAMLGEVMRNPAAGFNRGMVMGFSGLAVFTFVLLTPTGWLTMYLLISGSLRMGGAWFDDPVGDPILTALDAILLRGRTRVGAARERAARETLEGPEVPDRVVTPAAAGLTGCDLVIVASRSKAGWKRGVAVFTSDACYRIGDPIERTIAGQLRTLYPLSEHTDFEAIRQSVQYELPERRG